ncbi:MAG: Gfo/Idh/MocA family oxidoreductase [Chloroflexi bacterium]|nr:Gfo/Idh/MocA family oxidoreductase [Chloroflexota bacterium]
MQLRIAFIGCGGHSSANLIAETPRIPEIDLVAVCDLDEARARSAARRFGALAWYTDFPKMLAAERPDAVAVIGPPTMEIEIGAAVLEQGCHLFVEKPIGRNSREARPLVEAARRSSRHTQVGFMSRHAPAMRRGKLIVDSPEFGTPTYLETRHWLPGRLHAVWGIEDLHYAYLMLHGIHAVDLLRYLFGEVDEVYARTSQADGAGSLVSLCQFANGANGVVNLHTSAANWELRYEAVGSLGRRINAGFDGLTDTGQNRWAPELTAEQGQLARVNYAVNRGDRMGYRTELQHFANALLKGEEPFPSVADGLESTRLAEAMMASARAGRPVRVAEAPVFEL